MYADPSLSQGHLCIYEMMAEDSAVNYWEVSLGEVAGGTDLQEKALVGPY